MKLRSAVLFYGVVHRSLRYTAPSIRENLILPLSGSGPVDLYFHSWDNQTVHNPRGGEVELTVDPDDCKRLLPEAMGVTESDQGLRDTLVPGLPGGRNPFMHMTPDRNEAMLSLQNYLLALQSLERVFALMQGQQDRPYDLIAICRPDTRLLTPLPLRPHAVAAESIYLPMFHRYRGQNDRFAIGSNHSAAIYCNRLAPAQAALKTGAFPTNTESFLDQHLQLHGVCVVQFDLVCQRVRADGSVFRFDQALVHPDEDSPEKR